MTAYVLMIIILACLSAIQGGDNSQKWVGNLACILLILFAGLRYETGYDWLYYQGFFEASPTIGDLFSGARDFPKFSDPLYLLLNIVIKSLGGGVQVLFFAVAALSIGVMHLALSRFCKNMALVWLVYFGLAFLTAQLTLMRQAIACSLLIAALVYLLERRRAVGIVAMIAAAGFHISAALAWVVFLVIRFKPKAIWAFNFVCVGLVFALFSINIFPIVGTAAPYMPASLAYRVAYYTSLLPAPITKGSAALILLHLVLLAAYYVLPSEDKKNDPYLKVAIWLTLLVLSMHLFLWSFPNLWNRAMMLSLPWQIATLWRVWEPNPAWSIKNAIPQVGLAAFSLVAMVYTLSKPQASPFLPYQAAPIVALTGYCGDGYERLVKAQKENTKYLTPQKALPDEIVATEINRGRSVSSAIEEATDDGEKLLAVGGQNRCK